MRKKVMERFGETRKRKEQDESDTLDKKKQTGLNKISNLDQKTCKEKTMKVKLGKDSITSS